MTKSEFKHFDVVSDDSDHHFCHQNHHIPTQTQKSIMKEWKILEPNLPDSIYVRVYENRIDLMRAVIIGAAGTPYHDGLFFFDIAFPSNYPNHPPNVHFTSFGRRLNPNLHADGMVCLSLLNTWFGKQNERWDPSVSTCLQLLLSIQALVLNEKPYFNEPVSTVFGRNLLDGPARAYSWQVYCLTCKMNLRLLKKPPTNFDAFVKSHFRNHAAAILAAFTEYVNGRVMVGCYGVGGASGCSLPPRCHKVSHANKLWAPGFYRSMIGAFENCGACLDPSLRSLVLQPENENEKKKITIFAKAIEQIKRAFVWIGKKENGKEIVTSV